MSAIATLPAASFAPPTPSPQEPSRWKWTREQFCELHERRYFEGKRVQLIFGEIIEMGAQNWPHFRIVVFVVELLRRTFNSGFWVVDEKPLLLANSAPVPDVMVIPGAIEDFTAVPTMAALVVEVADTSLFLDTTTKAELYATGGILDYWVLDIENRQLHVFRDPVPLPAGLGATAYRTHTVLDTAETVSPLAAPHITIHVADLLPAPQTEGRA